MAPDQTNSAVPCPVCDSPRVRPETVFGKDAYRECRECGFVWRIDRENFEKPNEVYQIADRRVEELLVQEQGESRQAYYAIQTARLHRFITPPGKLLELGCGSGGLSLALHHHGWQVTAVDSSPALCRNARELLGAENVIEAPIEKIDLPPSYYDVVVALDILEHLPDVRLLPENVRQWLRPEGLVVLQTPNGRALRRYIQRSRWNQLKPDMHYLIHTKTSLGHLFEGAEFQILELTTVSGSATAGLPSRVAASVYGSILRALGMGNTLFMAARLAR